MSNPYATPLLNADPEWDASGHPHSRQYGDIYFSHADGLGESSHVFHDGNALRERWRDAGLRDFVIGELGFGTGLNFLNTCRLWCTTAPPGSTLHYLACELHPWHLADLRRLHAQWPELAPWRDALLAQYPEHSAGVHQLVLCVDTHRICLTLLYGDATAMLAAWQERHGFSVDAWFLDGFTPRLNPALWSRELLRLVAVLSHGGTTLASYSVSGILRQALDATGFAWEKRRGYTGKRHMLRAWPATGTPAPARSRGHVCIVGGGLAGCSTAFALAENGWQVTLLERAEQLASAASGNAQGILHCKPARVDSAGQRFNLLAYLHAARHYRRLAAERQLAWHACGMLQLAVNPALEQRFRDVAACGLHAPQLLRYVEADEASVLAGRPLVCGGLFFPDSGWLSPPALCAVYVAHPRIEVLCGSEVADLTEADGGWTLDIRQSGRRRQLQADRVVLCNSGDLGLFAQTSHYPLIVNRGQVDLYEAGADSAVDLVLCGPGYVLPAGAAGQCVGGSYYLGAQDAVASAARTAWHREQIGAYSPALAQALAARPLLDQRLGTRCVTRDRMPLLGPATRSPEHGGSIWPRLHLNVAHGSHGLTRTPLCAALLAAEFDALPPPLTSDLAALLVPDRFFTGTTR